MWTYYQFNQNILSQWKICCFPKEILNQIRVYFSGALFRINCNFDTIDKEITGDNRSVRAPDKTSAFINKKSAKKLAITTK